MKLDMIINVTLGNYSTKKEPKMILQETVKDSALIYMVFKHLMGIL